MVEAATKAIEETIRGKGMKVSFCDSGHKTAALSIVKEPRFTYIEYSMLREMCADRQ